MLSAEQDAALVARFSAAVEPPYRRIQAGLRRKGADLAKLSREYQQVLEHDW